MSDSTGSLVLVHPPSVSRRYLPTRFPPHGMATVFAGLARLGLPVVQADRLMDSLYDDPGGLDVHGADKDLDEAGFRAFLETGQGPRRLADFVERHLGPLPVGARVYAFSVVSYHQYFGALLLVAELKRRSPQSKTIIGGPFATVKPTSFLHRLPGPDAWVKGCGVEALAAFWRDPAATDIFQLHNIIQLVGINA